MERNSGLLVTTDTGFVFELPVRGFIWTGSRLGLGERYGGPAHRPGVHSVAIIAAHVVATMASRFPEGKLTVACVAAHARLCLLLCRNFSLSETHREPIILRIDCVVWVASVACRTGLPEAGG